jgi:hypothetical protein
MYLYLRAAVGTLLLLSLGCSTHPAPPTVAVSGKVTMDRAPLAKASIQFLPMAADRAQSIPEAFGVTDDRGRYTLKLGGNYGDVAGAPVGKYRVNIGKMDRDTKGGPRQAVPGKYNRNSQLTYSVPPEGTTEANFDLSSK